MNDEADRDSTDAGEVTIDANHHLPIYTEEKLKQYRAEKAAKAAHDDADAPAAAAR